jgi:NAD-dependent SIR2 family protein deacetylase
MKTVFILGAGFSIDAGAPSQAKLIDKILELETKEIKSKINRSKLKNLIAEFKTFVEDNLLISINELGNIYLEDIFTPLDRCILDDISFREISPKELILIREKIFNLIIIAIRENIHSANPVYIQDFAKHLIKLADCRKENIKEDRISVITTNWDILLDNALQSELDKLNSNKIKKEKLENPFEGVVDYCCYVSSLKENDERIKPGLYALGKGKFNVKLLKLHGSMNWMQCPRCQRLYVDFYKIFQGGYVFTKKFCNHCKKEYKIKENENIRLRPNLIMPTFLKDLNNFQIKLIWQNAGIELSEADTIIFIGYSLPHADFELRQLLSRMLRKDVQVNVILSENDKLEKSLVKYSAEHRYKSFFGDRNVKISYEGAKEFVKNL